MIKKHLENLRRLAEDYQELIEQLKKSKDTGSDCEFITLTGSDPQAFNFEYIKVRYLLSECMFKILILTKRLTSTYISIWSGVHKILICFGQFTKGRIECL